MKAVVAAFNQEKALVGAFSVIMNIRIAFVRISNRDTALAAAAAARANIIHHHKLNLQIEFSAAQHYAVALQCCMLRAAVPSDDEVTVIYRAKVAIKSGGGATNHGKVSTEDTLT